MNAIELFMLDHEAKLGHMRACTAQFEGLAQATRDILMPLLHSAHKGYPLTKLIGYHGCTYARWFDEHGAMLEGMGYRVSLGAGSLIHPEAARVYCQIDHEFVQDMALAQQLIIQGDTTGNPLWL